MLFVQGVIKVHFSLFFVTTPTVPSLTFSYSLVVIGLPVTAQTSGRMKWHSFTLNSNHVPQAEFFLLENNSGFLLINWNSNARCNLRITDSL